MFKSNPTSPSLRHPFRAALRAAVTLTVLTGCIAFADAQTTGASGSFVQGSSGVRPISPAIQIPALDTSATPLFSSSSDQAAAADGTTTEASLNPAVGVNFANYMQYGGGQRRRYGTPRYRGNNTNADGSPKYSFFAGAGLAQPIGNTWHYLTPSYGFQVGAGRNFNAKLGLMLQFDYDHFGFTGQTIANQFNILNSKYVYNGQLATIDGSSHVWSFTLDPVFNVVQGKTAGFYLVAGAGFFHKTANFTTPATGTYCDYYYGCYQYQANQTIDKYTSNAPGFDGGFGLTYKFSRFSNERFYVEARYVFVDNSHRAGIQPTNAGIASITATTTNLYPANSNRTSYIPIKVGLRF